MVITYRSVQFWISYLCSPQSRQHFSLQTYIIYVKVVFSLLKKDFHEYQHILIKIRTIIFFSRGKKAAEKKIARKIRRIHEFLDRGNLKGGQLQNGGKLQIGGRNLLHRRLQHQNCHLVQLKKQSKFFGQIVSNIMIDVRVANFYKIFCYHYICYLVDVI